jgi:hypothetical protein
MGVRSNHEPMPGTTPRGLADGALLETVEHMEQDVNNLVEALGLLGVKPCSRCRKFFRSSEPGALFDSGEMVCFTCVPEWWNSTSEQLRVSDREKLEGKLSSWLRKYHRAEVVKEDKGKTQETTPHQFQIVVHCTECRGSGKLLEGERCRFCNGFGTVRVVVPK